MTDNLSAQDIQKDIQNMKLEYLRQEDFHKELKAYRIENYEVLPDNSLIVRGDVNLRYKTLNKLPFRFAKVEGDFICTNNNLTSLEGAPAEVGGNFLCSYNRLTSLEHAPRVVRLHFDCSNNNLYSLQYAPEKVGLAFLASHNLLTNLEHAPLYVDGIMDVSSNPLSSLKLTTDLNVCQTIYARAFSWDKRYEHLSLFERPQRLAYSSKEIEAFLDKEYLEEMVLNRVQDSQKVKKI